ncbi:protein archease-like [Lineus longissimus]|uniref:protein archease-like n=1 Tax=Lineus longissimus TaxID=88925 RepID=UPI00315DDE8B
MASAPDNADFDPNVPVKYEYLDHPADFQIHSWGDTLQEAFEQSAVGMFGIMTDLATIDVEREVEFEVNNPDTDDKIGLLFHFLDEALFLMSGDYFICKGIKITEFDLENFRIKAKGYGEEFQIGKHPQNCEVKAITYSNIQIQEDHVEGKGKFDLFVIVDV